MNLADLQQLLRQPQGRELDIGRALQSMRSNGDFPVGHASLRELVASAGGVDYSTAMKWVRAADFMAERNDWLCCWGVSRILELLRIADPAALDRFLATLDPAAPAPSVRALRSEISRFLGQPTGPKLPTAPHEVVAKAVHIALRQIGIDPSIVSLRFVRGRPAAEAGAVSVIAEVSSPASARALAVAADVMGEIAQVREAWRPTSAARPVSPHWAIPLTELERLAPGPLEVSWAAPDMVHVVRDGTVIIHLPVQRISIGKVVKPSGNRKTAGVAGIINSIHLGCLRGATGLPKCDAPCYRGEHSAGCYANETEYARQDVNQNRDFDTAQNGITNDALSIRLPVTGNASLRRYGLRGRDGERPVWRVDSESADGAMSIALGNLQVFAEANPEMRFVSICSHAVRPSNAMLCWLGALSNIWVGSTVSGWLDPGELDHRFRAIERFISYDIPSVVWITTHPTWDNQSVLERALTLVPPERIIEYPLRGTHRQELPVLNVNPFGACGDHRVDRAHRPFIVTRRASSDGQSVRIEPDGHDCFVQHPLHARCSNCRLRCGLPALVADLR